MNRISKEVLRLQIRELKRALHRGSVFVGYGRDDKSDATLVVHAGWRPFINRLSFLYRVPSPVVRGRARVSAVWELVSEAEARLKTLRV